MNNGARFVVLLVSGALFLIVAFKLFRPAIPPQEPPAPYTLSGGRIKFLPGSRFLPKLEIVVVGRASSADAEFRSVGQIIALSNASGSLTGERTSWVELDPQLSRSIGLNLAADRPAGMAYGLTHLAVEYGRRIEIGQNVEITRYGLMKSNVTALVVKVTHRVGDGTDVVFRFSEASDWFPGTNCEVTFPLLRGHPLKIPTTAPIHEGTLEYVWKETAPGEFMAQNISLIDATPSEVSVLGLNPGDRIVGRGAILLKPLLKSLLAQSSHAS